jgi:transcriptional regulator with XRE-family HTH domain
MPKYELDREKIRTLRFGKRLTNEDVAKKLGISRNQYGKKESAASSFKDDEICALASILDCAPGFLFAPSVSNEQTKS